MQEAPAIDKPSVPARFVRHLIRMPTWHKYVLTGAMALVAIGIVGHVRQLTASTSTPQNAATDSPHSNFAGTDSSSPTASTAAADQTPWYLSPRFLSIGGSVLGGFVIGWAMRVFVKTTMLVGFVVAALFAGLSRFHIMNVDLTSAHQQYDSTISWLTDQAWRLKDVAIAHIPVHFGGLFGMFLGFRRTRL